MKTIPTDISNFFEYDGSELLGNLLYSAIFIFRSSFDNHEELILEILEKSGINQKPALFMQSMEEYYLELKSISADKFFHMEMRHAPSCIQNNPLLWPYYAFFWTWYSDDITFEQMKTKLPPRIGHIILRYHLDHLSYRQNEANFSDQRRSSAFYENVARGVTRGVELLSGLYIRKKDLGKEEEEYLEELYFQDAQNDWLFNFYNILENNIIEANSFLIQEGSTSGYYINYSCIAKNIGPWHFQTSRKTVSGKSRDKGVNANFANYMASYHAEHIKMRNLVYKEKSHHGGGIKKAKVISQYTVVEPFEKWFSINIDKPDQPLYTEEAIEQQSKISKRSRTYPNPAEGDAKIIPNVAQQRKRNRAFSARITKRALLLKTDYEVPPKEHLKAFAEYVFSKKIEPLFNKEDFFRAVFLTSLMTGQDYQRALRGIFLLNDNMMNYKQDINFVEIAIDPSLFSKEKQSEFMVKSHQKISYRLPNAYAMLWSKVKNLINSLDENEIEELSTVKCANEYVAFLTSIQNSFPKKIKINFRHPWRIIATYRREMYLEDMSVLFCMGKHQGSDESRLAYAATQKMSDSYSGLIEQLYIDLGLHKGVCAMIGIPLELFQPSMTLTVNNEYTGTKRVLNQDKSVRFFSEIKKMALRENSQEAAFNLFSIGFRYALSIALGTRTGYKSDSFEHMSMHTIMISEKAETISLGMRIIPVCDIAENLIQRYLFMARSMGFDATQTIFISNGKSEGFTTKKAVSFLKDYGAADEIQEFVLRVPLNTGRHIVTKYAIEHNFNGFYLEAFLGHYISGGEHEGIFSTMNMSEYINSTRKMLNHICDIYGVTQL